MSEPKNIALYIVFAVLFWGGVIATVILLKPEGLYALLFFLLLLFIAVSLSGIVLIGTIRRGLLLGLGIVSLLTLRLFSLDTLLNVVLLIGFLLMVELYFSRSEEK